MATHRSETEIRGGSSLGLVYYAQIHHKAVRDFSCEGVCVDSRGTTALKLLAGFLGEPLVSCCCSCILWKSAHASRLLSATLSLSGLRTGVRGRSGLLCCDVVERRVEAAGGYERQATTSTASHENTRPRRNQTPPPRSFVAPIQDAITAGTSIPSKT